MRTYMYVKYVHMYVCMCMCICISVQGGRARFQGLASCCSNNNNNNNNHLKLGVTREEFFRRRLPPLGGSAALLYFGLLPSPIPAVPPYLMKTHHIHGPWSIGASKIARTPHVYGCAPNPC